MKPPSCGGWLHIHVETELIQGAGNAAAQEHNSYLHVLWQRTGCSPTPVATLWVADWHRQIHWPQCPSCYDLIHSGIDNAPRSGDRHRQSHGDQNRYK